jgi:hypothetical protein
MDYELLLALIDMMVAALAVAALIVAIIWSVK